MKGGHSLTAVSAHINTGRRTPDVPRACNGSNRRMRTSGGRGWGSFRQRCTCHTWDHPEPAGTAAALPASRSWTWRLPIEHGSTEVGAGRCDGCRFLRPALPCLCLPLGSPPLPMEAGASPTARLPRPRATPLSLAKRSRPVVPAAQKTPRAPNGRGGQKLRKHPAPGRLP